MDGERRLAGSLGDRLRTVLAPWLPSRSDAAIVAVKSARAIAETANKAHKTSKTVRRKAKKFKEAVIGESVYIPKLSAYDDNRDRGLFAALEKRLPPRGSGLAASLAFVLVCAGLGLHFGGGYERAVYFYGAPRDIAARTVGFEISKVSVTGTVELSEQEVIDLSGVTSVQSLAFLDADKVQNKLLENPLIAEAEVRKLFPNRLTIRIKERSPSALWQKDGEIHLVAQDGAIIDSMKDDRFSRLPHVVGEGANLRVAEFATLLEAAGDLKPKIRAGVLVSDRRWNLKMANGVDVKLPEYGAAEAVRALARLDREAQVLDRAIISVDLRLPGRAAFRLTEEAAAQRAEALKKKPDGKKKA
jgi:cell division protein FtsQ